MWYWIKLLGASFMYLLACAFAILVAMAGYWGSEHYQIEPPGMRSIIKTLAVFVFVDNVVDVLKVLRTLISEYEYEKEAREARAAKANEEREKG